MSLETATLKALLGLNTKNSYSLWNWFSNMIQFCSQEFTRLLTSAWASHKFIAEADGKKSGELGTWVQGN